MAQNLFALAAEFLNGSKPNSLATIHLILIVIEICREEKQIQDSHVDLPKNPEVIVGGAAELVIAVAVPKLRKSKPFLFFCYLCKVVYLNPPDVVAGAEKLKPTDGATAELVAGVPPKVKVG